MCQLSTACKDALHPETRLKARISHLPPAIQRRGDRSAPSAEPKQLKKDVQTEPSSRLIKSLTGPTFPTKSIVFNRPSTIDLPTCKPDIF
ncbi:hypothetical protein DY000_02063988 [Brassica cretica]|uniref:TPX2 central domain-containing protein n=1 Tax=Brassica cretica TaxID=69181 RepID=A0ABQ7AXW1_BRACR|nr:hypothetical protein DY000_02063988 [Brassica cretica]